MEELKEQIDEVVLDIFQVLEDLYKRQAELEQVMKDGFFTMARARYSMGVKRVTADQIVDADLTANRRVELKEDDGNRSLSDDGQDVFILHNDSSFVEHDSTKDKTGSDSLSKGNDSSVRKRGADKHSSDLDKEFEKVVKLIDGETDDKKFKLTNPINLFGVLVPQTLRSSQKSFEESVRLSVVIANGKYKLNMLQKKLVDLKQKKFQLSSHEQSSRCVDNES